MAPKLKLIGSKTEADYRNELIKVSEVILAENRELKNVLECFGHKTSNAFILHWHPDQATEYYSVLIEGSYLIHVELEKYDKNSAPDIERQELEQYCHGLSKTNQIRLAVALDLVVQRKKDFNH